MKFRSLCRNWVEILSVILFVASVFFFIGAQRFRKSISNDEPDQFSQGDRVTIVEVIDGDEVVIERQEFRAILRLEGVDAFEATGSDPLLAEYGKIARYALLSQVKDAKAELRLSEKRLDLKGRLLGRLSLGDMQADPGLQLIKEGYAVTFTRFSVPHQDLYLAAEKEARGARRGFWADQSISARIDAMKLRWEKEARND